MTAETLGFDTDVERISLVERAADEKVNWKASTAFIAVHFAPLAALFFGVTVKSVVIAVTIFYLRMFFITAGYHRYFSHRSYKLGRTAQFIMAFGGTTAAQKGPLWWAANHRHHHRYSDTPEDIHSPQKGFLWSHVGWILCDKFKGYDSEAIKDFSKYPELVWLNRNDWVGPVSLGATCFFIGGFPGLIGFFASTIALWHCTFFINSLAHVMGHRRYVTTDTSRNSFLLAALTLGEGWHNNHHYHQSSARQGFFWWEYDISFYVLKMLSWVGIVKDLRVPTKAEKATGRLRDGFLDIGVFRARIGKLEKALAKTRVRAARRFGLLRDGGSERIAALIEAEHKSLDRLVHATREGAESLALLNRKERLGVLSD